MISTETFIYKDSCALEKASCLQTQMTIANLFALHAKANNKCFSELHKNYTLVKKLKLRKRD